MSPDIKTRERHYGKWRLYANNSYDYTCKHPQKIVSKASTVMYKKNLHYDQVEFTPWMQIGITSERQLMWWYTIWME